MIGTMVGLTIYGLKKGHISSVVGGIDGDHRICGFDKGVEDYHYLYIPDSALALPTLE
jgi:hypothetical protein